MQTFIFDIETGPLPSEELEAMIPPFDPAEVKTGNIKDPEKIAARIAEAEAAHRQAYMDRAALDPLTGMVIAIGILDFDTDRVTVIAEQTEAETLKAFWGFFHGLVGVPHRIVGFNNYSFDLPFLVRRSWKYGLLPAGIRNGRYWANQFADLREEWQMGDRMARGSLDSICRHLGLGAKTGNGKEFAELWRSDRPKALEYLRNDLALTARLAVAMGIVGRKTA